MHWLRVLSQLMLQKNFRFIMSSFCLVWKFQCVDDDLQFFEKYWKKSVVYIATMFILLVTAAALALTNAQKDEVASANDASNCSATPSRCVSSVAACVCGVLPRSALIPGFCSFAMKLLRLLTLRFPQLCCTTPDSPSYPDNYGAQRNLYDRYRKRLSLQYFKPYQYYGSGYWRC